MVDQMKAHKDTLPHGSIAAHLLSMTDENGRPLPAQLIKVISPFRVLFCRGVQHVIVNVNEDGRGVGGVGLRVTMGWGVG
jgi:hypothetical protein